MRRFLPISILLLLTIAGQQSLAGQAYEDCVVIWNGFSQNWGYNHRINRLGDYAEIPAMATNGCRTRHVHTAASGSGADLVQYTSYYTTVEVARTKFNQYETTLEFDGNEGEMIHAETELALSYPECRDRGWSVNAVLNGFDLYTSEGVKADKIQEFHLAIDTVWTDKNAKKVHVIIAADLLFACSSLECEPFNNEVQYEMKVQCLVVHGQDFRFDGDYLGRGFSWTRDSLADDSPIPASVLGAPGFPAAALGIQSLRIKLDDEHHFSDWSMYIHPQTYSPESGRYTYEAGLYFGQWNADQYDAFRKYYIGKPAIPPKWAVKRENGSAIVEIGVALLQFRNAKTEPSSISGKSHWKTVPGRQIPASDSMAVSIKVLLNR